MHIPQSWSDPRLTLKNTNNYGKGVFATARIPKGEIVVAFGGHIIPQDLIRTLPEQIQDTPYQVSDNFYFGPVSEDQLTIPDHFNHSCDANCGFISEIFLSTMRDIDEGEELTFDYATCMINPEYNMECKCNSPECRKQITGNDWMDEGVQKKYRGFFQPFIAKKIT